jgi:uncharacterized protein YndB with AHSA1/START domain
MEDRFNIGIDDLWAALTDSDRLAHWYGEVEGELSQGSEFRVRIALAGERIGQVEAYQPRQRLLLTMRDPDPQPGQPDQTVIEAQLNAEGVQTRLVWEERACPSTCSQPTARGSKFTSRIWPTTSAVASFAASRPAGTCRSQPTQHRALASLGAPGSGPRPAIIAPARQRSPSRPGRNSLDTVKVKRPERPIEQAEGGGR